MSEPIGRHLLRDGSFAYGLGLGFGHAEATTLEHLAQAAKTAGASGIRVAADRALMMIGLTAQTTPLVVAEAERLRFVVRADDPRRYVIACAGAPICASAHIAARTLAPAVTEAAGKYLDSPFRIHISGCAKGCAHAGPAGLTVVGQSHDCVVIANGTVRDAPVAVTTANELPTVIAELARQAKGNAGHV